MCSKCVSKQELPANQKCPNCHRSSPDGLTHIKCKTPFSAEGQFVCYQYNLGLKNFLRNIKFHHVRDIDSELTNLFSIPQLSLLKTYWKENGFLVTFVPISNQRLRTRGFNQAEIIAKNFAALCNLGTIDTLNRHKQTKPQFNLDRRERGQNIRNSFSVKNFRKNQNLILIDDLVTTGVTSRECVKTLRRKGFGKIWILSLAG